MEKNYMMKMSSNYIIIWPTNSLYDEQQMSKVDHVYQHGVWGF